MYRMQPERSMRRGIAPSDGCMRFVTMSRCVEPIFTAKSQAKPIHRIPRLCHLRLSRAVASDRKAISEFGIDASNKICFPNWLTRPIVMDWPRFWPWSLGTSRFACLAKRQTKLRRRERRYVVECNAACSFSRLTPRREFRSPMRLRRL